jgi:hypothetical protein
MRAAGIFFLTLVLLAFILAFCGCTTTTTIVRVTDAKGGMTETETVTKASDSAALALAGQIATAYAPRGIVVRSEKSTSDLGRILRGRPITREEIANRWKP